MRIILYAMGIADLRDMAVLEDKPLSVFGGKTVAIDMYQYLYCYSTVIVRYRSEDVYTSSEGENLSNILALAKGLPMLLREGIDPVFVFDGSADALKQETIADRKQTREEAVEKMEQAAQQGDVEAMRRYRAQAQRITEQTIETSKQFLDLLGIPYVWAPKAGEKYAADLVKEDYADAVVTDDYDSLLFGAPETIRNYSGSGNAELMDLNATLDELGITQQQLVDLALLIGTDYNPGVSGIGPKRGLKRIQKHGDIHTVLAESDASIDNVDALRSIFLDNDSESAEPDNRLDQGDREYAKAIGYGIDLGLDKDEITKQMSRFPGY